MNDSLRCQRLFAVLICILVACSGCSSNVGGLDGPRVGVETLPAATATPAGDDWTVESVTRPTTPEELNIAVDEDGRPLAGSWYDWQANQMSQQFVSRGMVEVPDGELALIDGIGFGFDRAADELHVRVELPSESWELFTLRVIDPAGADFDTNAMVVLRSPDSAAVSYWGDLEFAYGTDGGMGGLSNPAALDLAAAAFDADYDGHQPLPEEWASYREFEEDSYLLDVDNRPGYDTFLFSNDWGDGGFPFAIGYTAEDEIAAVAVWNMSLPWRAIFPDSDPPAQVVSREDDLLGCLQGTRPVEIANGKYVYCPSEDW